MKNQIVTYKVVSRGMPSDDEGELNKLCATMNANPESSDIIYRVEEVKE